MTREEFQEQQKRVDDYEELQGRLQHNEKIRQKFAEGVLIVKPDGTVWTTSDYHGEPKILSGDIGVDSVGELVGAIRGRICERYDEEICDLETRMGEL